MSDTETIPTEKLVKAYIKMREARSKLKESYEAQDKDISEQMKLIEHTLLDVCKSAGADSIRTNSGTIMRGIKTHYWTSDWESMHSFIRERNALELLERRISQRAMGDFLKANPDALPKGLNVDSSYTITIRRASPAKDI